MGVERARVVGHGFGAQVALALALTVPERVSGLALLAPAGLEKYSEREQAWFRENLFGVLFTYSDDEDLVRAHRDQFAR
ncbi:MAG: hypothetical protein KC620_25440, partial [Myxococcales bacterium]|nr:hypothetical protein [Myxococcales bacterium]